MAVRADLGRGAVGTAGAVTDRAGLIAVHADLFLAAEGRLLKADGHTQADALAPLGRIGVPALSGAEATAKEAAENIPQIAKVEAAGTVSTAAGPRSVVRVHTRKAELVITGFFIRVRENLIGLVDLLELLLRLFIVRIQVRVILPGHLLICFFDLVLRGALIDAQDLVIITFFRCHTLLLHARSEIRSRKPPLCGIPPFQAPQS